ncbi:MAG: hypothetical protein KFF73_15515, partial [Cyclobacteriaceae bacterium]|nr:hypothetical protein [Cyclobacteriaceae bacterium]
MKRLFKLIIALIPLFYFSCQSGEKDYLIHRWSPEIQRNFLGEMFWGNRLQDWQVNNGRLECIDGREALRTVHILTHEMSKRLEPFEVTVTLGTIHGESIGEDAFAGLLLGAGPLDLDYRGRSLVSGHTGKQAGIIAGINGIGEPVLLDMENNLRPMASEIPVNDRYIVPGEGTTITVRGIPGDNEYHLSVRVKTPKIAIEAVIPSGRLEGNLALVAHHGNDASGQSFWFNDLMVSGPKFNVNSNRILGPIVSTQHSLSRRILNMSAQMMPLGKSDPLEITLQYKLKDQSDWEN